MKAVAGTHPTGQRLLVFGPFRPGDLFEEVHVSTNPGQVSTIEIGFFSSPPTVGSFGGGTEFFSSGPVAIGTTLGGADFFGIPVWFRFTEVFRYVGILRDQGVVDLGNISAFCKIRVK